MYLRTLFTHPHTSRPHTHTQTLRDVAPHPPSTRRQQSLPLTPLSPRHHDNPSPRRSSIPLRTRPPLANVSLDSLVEAPCMGMLEWEHRNVKQVASSLVMEIDPEKLTNQIPCLPAHMMFMCLRFVVLLTIAYSHAHATLFTLSTHTHTNAHTLQICGPCE